MLLLSREDIKQVFSMRDTMEAVKQAFMMFSEGKIEVPLRSAITAKNGGTFLSMPAFSEELGVHCIKYCNNFSQNIEKGLPTLPTQLMMSRVEDGIIFALLDGICVTQMRTGASSGVAFEALAKQDCKKGALIGTGGMAACQLEAMLCARKLEEVWIYDLNAERCQVFVERMQAELAAYGVRLVAAKSSDEAVEEADLLITMTPSKTPVFDGNKVKPGATVSCVGSFTPEMQEMSPAVLMRASKLYFDSKEAVLSESGDILTPLKEGLITEALFAGDIGDVLLGKLGGRDNDTEIIVYETVGIGAQDIVTAKAIYDRAAQVGVGTDW